MHSSVSCGENQSMSLPVSGFNTSPHPLPHSENVYTAYTQIRSKWSNLPHWLSCEESACQCRRHRFNPWVRRFPWRRKWQPIRVFLPGESHEQRSLVGYGPWGHRVRHDLVTKHQQTTYIFIWKIIYGIIIFIWNIWK